MDNSHYNFPGEIQLGPRFFAQLDPHPESFSATGGTHTWCADCMPCTLPCLAGGPGSYALHENGQWDCPCFAGGGGPPPTGFELETIDETVNLIRADTLVGILNCVGNRIRCANDVPLQATDILVSCVDVGGGCFQSTDCCTGVCNAAGLCGCAAPGVACVNQSDCCNGSCQNGFCSTNFCDTVNACTPTCQSLNDACSRTSDCCEGFCFQGTCVIATTTTTSTTSSTTTSTTSAATTTTSTSTSSSTSTSTTLALLEGLVQPFPSSILGTSSGFVGMNCVVLRQVAGISGATHLIGGFKGTGSCGIAIYQDSDSGSSTVVASGSGVCGNPGALNITVSSFNLSAGASYRWCVCSDSSLAQPLVLYNGIAGHQIDDLLNTFSTSVGISATSCTAAVPPDHTGALSPSNPQLPILVTQ